MRMSFSTSMGVSLETGRRPEQLPNVNKARATVRWRKEIACILAGNLITSAY
jgi:hypothetical protein